MRIRITFKPESEEIIMKELKSIDITDHVVEENKAEAISRIYDIEPSKYRELNLMCKKN